jgi:hypothetical protein
VTSQATGIGEISLTSKLAIDGSANQLTIALFDSYEIVSNAGAAAWHLMVSHVLHFARQIVEVSEISKVSDDTRSNKQARYD